MKPCRHCKTPIPESYLSDLCVPCQRALHKKAVNPQNWEGADWRWNGTAYAPVNMFSGWIDYRCVRPTRREALAAYGRPLVKSAVRVKKITLTPAWREPDPWLEQARLAAVNTLKRELERAKARLTAAENAQSKAELNIALMEQDMETIREIIEKGGSAADVLKFINTPPAS